MATVQHSERRRSSRSLNHMPVVLAVLGIGAIALIVGQLQSIDNVMPMLAICGLCLAALVVVRPEIGIFTVLICAAVVKVTIGTGTGSMIVTSLMSACVLLAGWIAHRMLHKERFNLLPGWVAIPIFCVIGFTLFAWIWGRLTLDPRIPMPPTFFRVQMAQALLIIVSVALLFVGADLLRDRRLRYVLAAMFIGIGLVDLTMRTLLPDSIVYGTLYPISMNTFGLFGVWFVALCWSNALLNTNLLPLVRLVLFASAFAWLLRAIVVHGGWVSGWIPPVVAVIVISFFAGPRVAVPMITAASAFVAVKFSYFYDLLVTSQVAEGSFGGEYGRLELWQRNLEFSKDWILLGSGPAGYVLYYVTFIPDQAMSTHSNYIDLLSQIGIGGLLSFLGVLVAMFVLGVRVLRRLDDADDRALCAAVVGGIPALMAAMWFGDWVIPFVYNQTVAGFNHSSYNWLMLAALAGLISQQREKATLDG